MSNIATSIEQSKHLLVLRLDIKSADMCLCKTAQDTWFLCAGTPDEYDAHTVPAWSLSALLEVMPKEHEPEIQKSPVTGQYFVYGFFDGEKPTYMTKDYDSPIDAAYEMVCYLLEQGLIEKGEEDEDIQIQRQRH